MEGFGTFERLSGSPSGAEAGQESHERFSEQYKKNQTAIKKIQKEESQKKKDDTTLAGIIVKLLKDPKYAQFFLLICHLTAKNIPSDLILAIIALLYEPARKNINERFTHNMLDLEMPKSARVSSEKTNSIIDLWAEKIFFVASSQPERIARTAFHEEKTADQEIIDFSVFVMQEFTQRIQREHISSRKIEKFCRDMWKQLIAQLKVHTEYLKLFEERKKVW